MSSVNCHVGRQMPLTKTYETYIQSFVGQIRLLFVCGRGAVLFSSVRYTSANATVRSSSPPGHANLGQQGRPDMVRGGQQPSHRELPPLPGQFRFHIGSVGDHREDLVYGRLRERGDHLLLWSRGARLEWELFGDVRGRAGCSAHAAIGPHQPRADTKLGHQGYPDMVGGS